MRLVLLDIMAENRKYMRNSLSLKTTICLGESLRFFSLDSEPHIGSLVQVSN